MSVINPSAIGEGKTLTKSFQERLAAAKGPEEIKEICHLEELNQGKISLDWDSAYRIPIEETPQTSFESTVTIAGVKHVLEAGSETELREKEVELYRAVFAKPAASNEPVRDAQGRFTADQTRAANTDAVAAAATISDEEKNNLQTQLQLGQISVAEYLEQSGAITDFLAKQGVPIEALKSQIEEKQAASFARSWEQATAEFLASSDWPGGEQNKNNLSIVIGELNLIDSPSADSLRRAYEVLKAKNALVEPPEFAASKQAAEQAARIAARIAAATTPAEIRDALHGNAAIWDR